MIIYLDTCALGRLTDDLSHPRLLHEAESVARILELVALKRVRWIASTVVQDEIEHNPHPARRIAAMELLATADQLVPPDQETFRLASEFFPQGLSGMDGIHLAVAQQAGADFLITTDDRFIQRAANLPGITVSVVNPVEWWQRRQAWLLTHS
jgi:predicted nucleic acid-binding protein